MLGNVSVVFRQLLEDLRKSSEIRLKVTVQLQIDNFLQILKITRVNFIKRRTEVNFQALIGSAIWEPSWLCLWAEFVCEAGKFFQRCFLETFFSPEGGHFKELQVKGNLFDCSEIWTVASFTYKQQKSVCEFFISINTRFFQERFLYDHSVLF